MPRDRLNPFTFIGFQALIRRNIVPAVMTMAFCCCSSLLAMYYVQAVYESSLTASIPSTYFKNPIVNDVMPEITDTKEIETQKRSLFKRALSDDFLDALGEKYGLFEYSLEDSQHAQERKKLISSIKFIPIDTSTFRITVQAPLAATAHDITQDVLDKLRFTLIEERFISFTQARNAITAEMQILESRASAKQKAELDALRTELDLANTTIDDLRERYTESHPELYQMQKRAQELRDKILGKEASSTEVPDSSALSQGQLPLGGASLYTELARKLTYLNVALSIEKGKQTISFLNVIEEPDLASHPIYPRANIFLQYGFAIGLLVVLAQTIILEIRRSQFYEPHEVAELLGVQFFGVIPLLPTKEWQFLIDNAALVREQKLLPPPT